MKPTYVQDLTEEIIFLRIHVCSAKYRKCSVGTPAIRIGFNRTTTIPVTMQFVLTLASSFSYIPSMI